MSGLSLTLLFLMVRRSLSALTGRGLGTGLRCGLRRLTGIGLRRLMGRIRVLRFGILWSGLVNVFRVVRLMLLCGKCLPAMTCPGFMLILGIGRRRLTSGLQCLVRIG